MVENERWNTSATPHKMGGGGKMKRAKSAIPQYDALSDPAMADYWARKFGSVSRPRGTTVALPSHRPFAGGKWIVSSRRSSWTGCGVCETGGLWLGLGVRAGGDVLPLRRVGGRALGTVSTVEGWRSTL
jgi:hypothetical protein